MSSCCYQRMCISFPFACPCLSKSNGLDDLEDGWSTHDKHEQRQHPRSNRILFDFRFISLRHVSSLSYILACLLVGNTHSLWSDHRWSTIWWVVDANQASPVLVILRVSCACLLCHVACRLQAELTERERCVLNWINWWSRMCLWCDISFDVSHVCLTISLSNRYE